MVVACRAFGWAALYALTGQYKGLTRYAGSAALYRLAGRNGLLVLLLAGIGVSSARNAPRALVLLLLLTGLPGAVRFALRDVLLNLRSLRTNNSSCRHYGAGNPVPVGGSPASQVITRSSPSRRQPGLLVVHRGVQPPQALMELKDAIDQVLWLSSLPRPERRYMSNFEPAAVLQVPSIDDLTSGRARIDALRPIAIEDLLGRDEVPVDLKLLGPGIRDAVVCVTGAGGTIGSELCRQILALSPARLILLERSESALYAIDQELRSLLSTCVELDPGMGSATDPQLLQRLFAEERVELVFHAAAYKHVPLVEVNPLAGLANNVGSTVQICRAAVSTGVRQVVLISTDKAVRPTNVMGASKRLAELVVQAFASEGRSTRFSMVRFGNVLGSSGSVVPLFRRQIAAGGPITLTHPEIIRYFMIPEAASLVLQSSLARGGDLFLLDMGPRSNKRSGRADGASEWPVPTRQPESWW